MPRTDRIIARQIAQPFKRLEKLLCAASGKIRSACTETKQRITRKNKFVFFINIAHAALCMPGVCITRRTASPIDILSLSDSKMSADIFFCFPGYSHEHRLLFSSDRQSPSSLCMSTFAPVNSFKPQTPRIWSKCPCVKSMYLMFKSFTAFLSASLKSPGSITALSRLFCRSKYSSWHLSDRAA